MRRLTLSLSLIAAIGLLSVRAYSAGTPQRATPASTTVAPAQTPEAALKALREDLQGTRADIMAKNLTLTADQAAKFWPLYAKFQAEQSVIVDQQFQAIKRYADSFATMDDATALSTITAHLSRDLQINTLRTKWLAEFQKILPARLAARAIQIDRRLGLAEQMTISAQLPLIH